MATDNESYNESYWGNCPQCREQPMCLNYRKENWMVCHECRLKWCVGIGLFTTSEEDWDRAAEIAVQLSFYRSVKPYHQPEPLEPGVVGHIGPA